MNRAYVRTDTILDKILAHKVDEVALLKQQYSLSEIRALAEAASPARDMLAALDKDRVALIAEVKHASPSKGILIQDFKPLELASAYEAGGASAISVLTDQAFFKGHLDDMTRVREAVSIPVLRKDFIIDAMQVYEARSASADAILLIVAALDDAQMADLYALAQSLGMAVLVEVHDESEMTRALKLDARLIGVNNRDLKSFHVDLAVTERLSSMLAGDTLLVAESGLQTGADVQRMGRVGAAAVLVGESLVRSDNIRENVAIFSSQERLRRL